MNILLSVPTLVWLILSGLVFAVGEFLSKEFGMGPSWTLAIVITAVYALSSLIWLPAILQKNQLSITGVLWSVISLLMTVLIGVLLFGERPSMTASAGIVLAFVSVILLSL